MQNFTCLPHIRRIIIIMLPPSVIDNGIETVTVIEDGKIKSKTVNGQAQITN